MEIIEIVEKINSARIELIRMEKDIPTGAYCPRCDEHTHGEVCVYCNPQYTAQIRAVRNLLDLLTEEIKKTEVPILIGTSAKNEEGIRLPEREVRDIEERLLLIAQDQDPEPQRSRRRNFELSIIVDHVVRRGGRAVKIGGGHAAVADDLKVAFGAKGITVV